MVVAWKATAPESQIFPDWSLSGTILKPFMENNYIPKLNRPVKCLLCWSACSLPQEEHGAAWRGCRSVIVGKFVILLHSHNVDETPGVRFKPSALTMPSKLFKNPFNLHTINVPLQAIRLTELKLFFMFKHYDSLNREIKYKISCLCLPL